MKKGVSILLSVFVFMSIAFTVYAYSGTDNAQQLIAYFVADRVDESVQIRDVQSPLDHLNDDRFEQLAYTYEVNNTFEEEQIKTKALDALIRTVSLVTKAKEVGITASEEEVIQFIDRVRNAALDVVPQEVIDRQKALMETFDMTEEEFWFEYQYNGYKANLLIEKLREKHIEDTLGIKVNEDMDDFMESVENEYRVNHADEIADFKDRHNIN